MKRFLIEDLGEVAYAMYDSIINDRLDDVMFVGCYDDIIEVIKELLMFNETLLSRIEIEPKDLDNYDKEYSVTLFSDMKIWCEKAYDSENKFYLYDETDRLFIADDCNSIILKVIGCNEDNIYEVTYGLDDASECDGNCTCCNCNDNHEVITRVTKDKDGKMKGFEKSWTTNDGNYNYETTYSFYSSNENMLKEMLNNFDIKF